MKYLIILLTVGFIACQKDNDIDDSNSASTMMDVSYGTDPAQKMDIYLPAGRSTTSTKSMILIHGGAWSTGDKTDFNQYVDSLKRRLPGYAIFNINYRLSTGGNNVFPAQEMDVKTAVEFIYNKRSDYRISDKVAILGASAGGHLALLQGYKYNLPWKPLVIVDFFGPTDMIDLYNNPASPLIPPSTVAGIVGATPTSDLPLYQNSSPIRFVTTQSPKTVILHGGLDPLVRVQQSTSLRDKLQQMGVTHQYIFYPNEGHSWVGPNLTDSFDKIQAFLNAHMN